MEFHIKPVFNANDKSYIYKFKCPSCDYENQLIFEEKEINDILGHILRTSCKKCGKYLRFAWSDGNKDMPILSFYYKSPYKIIFPSDNEFKFGNLAIICKDHLIGELNKLRKAASKNQIYRVRAYISDHIPLIGTIESLIEIENDTHIGFILGEPQSGTCSLYLRTGYTNPIYIDIFKTQDRNTKRDIKIDFIEFEAKSINPLEVFHPARTFINHFLNTLNNFGLVPFVIKKIELYVSWIDQPLLYEIFHPFEEPVFGFNSGGGLDSFPFFHKFKSLLRESLCSQSPYYRLLSAFKLYDEGIKNIRKEIYKLKSRFNIINDIPNKNNIQINVDQLCNMGFNSEFLNIKNVKELVEKFRKMRNLVAHLFMDTNKGDKSYLDLSDGFIYYNYTIASVVLLHYIGKEYKSLEHYFSKYISRYLTKGQILPLLNDKDKYYLDCNKYWQVSNTSRDNNIK